MVFCATCAPLSSVDGAIKKLSGFPSNLVCRFRVSGSFVTSGYETQSASLRGTNASFDISSGSTNSDFIRMGWQRFTGTTAGFTQNFEMNFYNLPSTSADKHSICHMVNNGNSTNDATFQTSSGTLDSDSASKCCKNFCTDQRHMFSVLQRSAYIRAFQRTYSHDHMMLQTDSKAPNVQVGTKSA